MARVRQVGFYAQAEAEIERLMALQGEAITDAAAAVFKSLAGDGSPAGTDADACLREHDRLEGEIERLSLALARMRGDFRRGRSYSPWMPDRHLMQVCEWGTIGRATDSDWHGGRRGIAGDALRAGRFEFGW